MKNSKYINDAAHSCACNDNFYFVLATTNLLANYPGVCQRKCATYAHNNGNNPSDPSSCLCQDGYGW
jgi:hypothetical protein